jgi:hypothetical protein
MTPEQRELTDKLVEEVAMLRQPAVAQSDRGSPVIPGRKPPNCTTSRQPADNCLLYRMPDDKELLATFDVWRNKHGTANLRPEDHLMLSGIVYYGPEGSPLVPDRFSDIVAYVGHWRRGKPFTPKDLLQLVWTYGLDVGRFKRLSFPGEHPSWAEQWHNAFGALLTRLDRNEQYLISELNKLPRFRRRSNNLGGAAPHLLGVLLERPGFKCGCVERYLDNHHRARQQDAEDRHRRQHLLSAWLDKRGWPVSEQYRRKIYPITRFIFRASVGDKPAHVRTFEQGLFFDYLLVDGVPLQSAKVIYCGESTQDLTFCDTEIEHLDYCQKCHSDSPRLVLRERLILKDDPNYERTVLKRCAAQQCGCFVRPDLNYCKEHLGKQSTVRRGRMIPAYRRLPQDNFPGQRGYQKKGGVWVPNNNKQHEADQECQDE